MRRKRLAIMCGALASVACARDPVLTRDQLALDALVRVVTPLSIETSGRTVTVVCLTRSWASATTRVTDPDSVVVAQLSDVHPPVRPISQCLKDHAPLYRASPGHALGPGIGDIPTPLDLLIDTPRWSSDTSASVVAGYSVNGLNGAEFTCVIRVRGNMVVVRECTLISISATARRGHVQSAG